MSENAESKTTTKTVQVGPVTVVVTATVGPGGQPVTTTVTTTVSTDASTRVVTHATGPVVTVTSEGEKP